jgi:hypothetical protein
MTMDNRVINARRTRQKKPLNVIDTGVQPSKILNGVYLASFISLHEGMVPNGSALAVDGLV